ncbi:MAG: substrate-binding domain-containing protein [Spirochaetales bacterium]|nr:substrate-binding domain-containing protein [Spirochaetales bacterium]
MGVVYKFCILTTEVHDIISQEIIAGIQERALLRGVEISVISSGPIKNIEGNMVLNRELYLSIISEYKFNGIIVLAGTITSITTKNDLKNLLESFSPTPVITISVKIDGFHSILSDNTTPVEELVDHIIKEHNAKRFMFIKGPHEHQEGDERFNGFRRALIKNNIELNTKYIFNGNFTPHQGAQAVKDMFERGLELPDAIICADDDTALGVYSELKRRSIEIGNGGVIVTGFDNTNYSRSMDPPLTTIDQSFHKQGVFALDSLISMLNNGVLVDEPFIPTVVHRESCGCFGKNSLINEYRKDNYIDLVIGKIPDLNIPDIETHINDIANIYSNFIMDNNFDISDALEDFIYKYKYKNFNLNVLHEIILQLHNKYLETMDRESIIRCTREVESVFSKIVEILHGDSFKEARNSREQSFEIDDILMSLATSMNFTDLIKVLNRNFYYLGIKSLMLHFDTISHEDLLEIQNKVFIKDDSLNRSLKTYCNLFIPMDTVDTSGYCRFEILLNSFHLGEVLSYQISRSIFLIELITQLNDKSKEIEHSYKDLRMTKDLLMETEKLANLGGLVVGFTHEISTPIGVGVTASTHLISEIDKFKNTYNKGVLKKSEMIEFISETEVGMDIIKKNLEKAVTFINGFKQISVDQASDIKRNFELVTYLHEVISSLTPILRQGNHNVKIDSIDRFEIDSYPGAISQIITNLVQNSITHGFENMENGEITITISQYKNRIKIEYHDNGVGIHPKNFDKIFDTYYSTKIGKGGSGLGLGIIKKLTEEKLLGSIECVDPEDGGATFILTI